MIRYSSYSSTNNRGPSERTYLEPLAAEYRELQELRERVKKAEAAAAQMAQEKAKLEERLRWLEINNAISPAKPCRPFPKVPPKYQNPENPAQKWSGRGKQPRWVRDQLKTGKGLDQLLIASMTRRSSATN